MSDDFPITIYHNPDCGTSRNTLAMIEAAGYSPTVIDYRRAGWERALLKRLFDEMGVTPRDVLRGKGTSADVLGLLDPSVDEATIFEAMLVEPILVNRPIVTSPRGTRLCRPSETVLALLDRQPDNVVKEDGEVVRVGDAQADV